MMIGAAPEDAELHVPILALTANAMSGARQRCLDAGMDEYLSKPISVELLQKQIAKFLG